MIKLNYIKGYINPMLFDSYTIRSNKKSNTKILQLDFLNDINIIDAFSNKWITTEMQNMISNTRMTITDHTITLEYADDNIGSRLVINDLRNQIFKGVFDLDIQELSLESRLDNILAKCKVVKYKLLNDAQNFVLSKLIKHNDVILTLDIGFDERADNYINNWDYLQDVNTWRIVAQVPHNTINFSFNTLNYPQVKIRDCSIELKTKEEVVEYINSDIIPCMHNFQEYLTLNELTDNITIDDSITMLIYKDGKVVCRWNLNFLYENRNIDIKSIIDSIFDIKTVNLRVDRGA